MKLAMCLLLAVVMIPIGCATVTDSQRTEANLHNAAKSGNLDAVRTLIAAGADVNARDSKDYSPLMLASKYGHDWAVKELLTAGADVNAQRYSDGGRALNYAPLFGKPKVKELLKGAGGQRTSLWGAFKWGTVRGEKMKQRLADNARRKETTPQPAKPGPMNTAIPTVETLVVTPTKVEPPTASQSYSIGYCVGKTVSTIGTVILYTVYFACAVAMAAITGAAAGGGVQSPYQRTAQDAKLEGQRSVYESQSNFHQMQTQQQLQQIQWNQQREWQRQQQQNLLR